MAQQRAQEGVTHEKPGTWRRALAAFAARGRARIEPVVGLEQFLGVGCDEPGTVGGDEQGKQGARLGVVPRAGQQHEPRTPRVIGDQAVEQLRCDGRASSPAGSRAAPAAVGAAARRAVRAAILSAAVGGFPGHAVVVAGRRGRQVEQAYRARRAGGAVRAAGDLAGGRPGEYADPVRQPAGEPALSCGSSGGSSQESPRSSSRPTASSVSGVSGTRRGRASAGGGDAECLWRGRDEDERVRASLGPHPVGVRQGDEPLACRAGVGIVKEQERRHRPVQAGEPGVLRAQVAEERRHEPVLAAPPAAGDGPVARQRDQRV